MTRDVGLLFKPELAEAIRRGAKTVTRRLDMRLAKLKAGDFLYHKEGLRKHAVANTWTEYVSDGALVGEPGNLFRWRWQRPYLSPLHMPRACARLRLRLVEDARVERLCDITEADAIAEGVVRVEHATRPVFGKPPREDGAGFMVGPDDGASLLWHSARLAFANAWDRVHPKAPWHTNPEVVVLRFEIDTRPRAAAKGA